MVVVLVLVVLMLVVTVVMVVAVLVVAIVPRTAGTNTSIEAWRTPPGLPGG